MHIFIEGVPDLCKPDLDMWMSDFSQCTLNILCVSAVYIQVFMNNKTNSIFLIPEDIFEWAWSFWKLTLKTSCTKICDILYNLIIYSGMFHKKPLVPGSHSSATDYAKEITCSSFFSPLHFYDFSFG